MPGGPSLFALVRFWSRRANAISRGEDAESLRVEKIGVLEAIAAVRDTGEVSVNDVAWLLGVDQSVASRMVSRAVQDGLVRQQTSVRDRRRVSLYLTPAGEELLSAAHDWQEEMFLQLTHGWAKRDVERFASYLDRLVSRLHDADGRGTEIDDRSGVSA
jgi:DNA-binding MarR family transcriptional regulator